MLQPCSTQSSKHISLNGMAGKEVNKKQFFPLSASPLSVVITFLMMASRKNWREQLWFSYNQEAHSHVVQLQKRSKKTRKKNCFYVALRVESLLNERGKMFVKREAPAMMRAELLKVRDERPEWTWKCRWKANFCQPLFHFTSFHPHAWHRSVIRNWCINAQIARSHSCRFLPF